MNQTTTPAIPGSRVNLSVRVPYDIRHVAKTRGGKWEPITKTWRMPSPQSASDVEQDVLAYWQQRNTAREQRQPTELGGDMQPITNRFRIARANGLAYPALL